MTRALAAGSVILSVIQRILPRGGRATDSAARGTMMRQQRVTIIAGIMVLSVSCSVRAQDQPVTCADWFAVQSWSGTITYSGSGSGSDNAGNSQTISESAQIAFTTAKGTTPCDINGNFSPGLVGWGWSADGIQSTYRVTAHDTFSTMVNDGHGGKCLSTINDDVTDGTSSTASAQVNMRFDSATSGTYGAAASQGVDGVTESISGCGHSSSKTVSYGWGPGSIPPNGIPLPSAIGPLSGSLSFTSQGGIGEPVQWTITWSLTPNINYDLRITSSPDYPSWRPAGGRSEKEPSEGLLGMNVVVVDKDTGEPTVQVSVDDWKFELKDVSHEPGVSMNYPPKKNLMTPTPADLDFKDLNDGPLAVFPNIKVSDDGLTLTATPDPSTDAQIAVFMNSRDWGAWGTLNVTIRLAGQTIKGHFAGDDATDILLPKRQQGSHIADSWKTEKNIPLETADSDDSETDPVGVPGCTGDGLTLYEEYRGFMENGKHIEGDPTKKDFFVQNLGGGDLKPGIRKFTAITGLNVHKDLLKDELDGLHPDGGHGDRLINFNHDQGAHEVDQHGVSMKVCPGINGGLTVFTQIGVHGKPGLTAGICMEWKNHGDFFTPTSLGTGNTHGGAITKSAATTQYDVAVAHELAHSVGVDHHGEDDPGATRFTLVGPSDPRNTSGAPAFLMEGQTGIVHLLREETGQDIAPPMWAKLTTETTKACGQVGALYGAAQFSSICQAFVQGAVPLFTNLAFYVGKPQRQHSGNDSCIMRYFFANAYQATGSNSTYYLSASGTEPVGNGLCPTPAGTGVNAPSHKPQSRYGDAAPNRGGCQKWVCVNDKNAPIPD